MPVDPIERQMLDLFVGLGPSSARERRERVVAAVADFQRCPEVTSNVMAEQLVDRFRSSRVPCEPVGFDRYFENLSKDIIPHAVNVASPRCAGHMSGVLPDFVGPLGHLITAMNQNLVKSEASKSLTLAERQVLAMLHRATFQRPDEFYDHHIHESGSTLGVMASGGTVANITAMWCARNACFGPDGACLGVEEEGLAAALRHYRCNEAVILASRLTHYSIEKAASILGLGARGVVKVAVDHRGRMSIPALEDAIASCRAAGSRIVAVVGVAGSTDCGSIDPIDEIAAIAEGERLYFHVDAAWGAPLLFSEQHRHLLTGIERADSVTVDGHKQLYLPVGVSALLLRNPEAARNIQKHAEYMLRPDSSDQGRFTLEGSRSAMVLFLHAALHLIGRQGYDRLVAANFSRAREFAERVFNSTAFELLSEPEMNIVLYRYLPRHLRDAARLGRIDATETRLINVFNVRLQNAEYQQGATLVSRTCVDWLPQSAGAPMVALRAVIANPLMSSDDIGAILDDQLRLATKLEREGATGSAG